MSRRSNYANCSHLWENKESLLLYLAKLKELMEPEQNLKPGTGIPNDNIMKESNQPTSVRALFIVSEVAKTNYGHTVITCHATQGKNFPTDKESQDFAEATPSGELKFNIAKDRAAATFFEPGDEVYLTFEKRIK